MYKIGGLVVAIRKARSCYTSVGCTPRLRFPVGFARILPHTPCMLSQLCPLIYLSFPKTQWLTLPFFSQYCQHTGSANVRFHDFNCATLCYHGICCRRVSVCLSRPGTVPKWL